MPASNSPAHVSPSPLPFASHFSFSPGSGSTPSPLSPTPAATPAATPDALRRLYEPNLTFEERLGVAKGSDKMDLINMAYEQNMEGSGGITLPWFTASGERNIVKDSINQRNFKCTSAKYIKSLCENGMNYEVRSSPKLRAPLQSNGPYRAITFGQLSDAFYEAWAANPENALLRKTLSQGLKGCRVYKMSMPDTITAFVRDYDNLFNDGQKISWWEQVTGSLIIEAEWTVWKEKHGITSRGGYQGLTYEQCYAKWLQENYGAQFPNMRPYEAAKSLAHILEAACVITGFGDFLEKRSDLYHDSFSNEKAISCVQEVAKYTSLNFKRILNKDDYSLLMLEVLKFAVRLPHSFHLLFASCPPAPPAPPLEPQHRHWHCR